MPIVGGADGCRGGWICITLDEATSAVSHRLYSDAATMIQQQPRPQVLAIDIPIGLTDSGPRSCDRAARKLLGEPRARSVFPTPIRPALHAVDRNQACAITSAADGRRVGAQSWAIYPKIREVDAALSPAAQQWCFEIHPEICFWAWNGSVSMSHSKKKSLGRTAREKLIDAMFGGAVRAAVRAAYPRDQIADDDINDAFAALWTAKRIAAGLAVTIPTAPPIDAVGLRMEMKY